MKKIALWLFNLALTLLLAAAVAPAWAQIVDVNSAINKAGRQRMLSQRMAKAYLLIGQGVDADRAAKILDSSMSLFDRQLVELKNFAPTSEIRGTYFSLERSWLAYKDVLVGAKPSRDGARRVLALSDEILALADRGTQQLQNLSGTEQGRLVNKAGRMRMLSQRMAKLYLAVSWDVAPAAGKAELTKTRGEFSANLLALSGEPSNTAVIRNDLDLVKHQWVFFEYALDNREGDRRDQEENVATASERILEVMDETTGLYEKLSR